jgi:hypothetical protein
MICVPASLDTVADDLGATGAPACALAKAGRLDAQIRKAVRHRTVESTAAEVTQEERLNISRFYHCGFGPPRHLWQNRRLDALWAMARKVPA